MKFIVKDEPAGWAISVWVLDDRPTGWLLMVPDEVMRGEIVWRWEPVSEGMELPTPTFRFNWDFMEELANAMLKRHPKRVDDAVLETLNIERERVNTLLGYLTHRNIHEEKAKEYLGADFTGYQQVKELAKSLEEENLHLKQMVQDLQSKLLQAKYTQTMSAPSEKKPGMSVANEILHEVYSDTPSFSSALKEQTAPGPSEAELKALMTLGMVTPSNPPLWIPDSPPKFNKDAFVKAVEHEIKQAEQHFKNIGEL